MKEYSEIHITALINANTTSWKRLATHTTSFSFDYCLESIIIANEANGLAKIVPVFNGEFPLTYYINHQTSYKSVGINDVLNPFPSSTAPKNYKLKRNLKAGWVLDFLGFNSHTSSQKVYITLLGYIPEMKKELEKEIDIELDTQLENYEKKKKEKKKVVI